MNERLVHETLEAMWYQSDMTDILDRESEGRARVFVVKTKEDGVSRYVLLGRSGDILYENQQAEAISLWINLIRNELIQTSNRDRKRMI